MADNSLALGASIAAIIIAVLFKLYRTSQHSGGENVSLVQNVSHVSRRVWLPRLFAVLAVLIAAFVFLRILGDGDRARVQDSERKFASLERVSQKNASDLAGAQAAVASLRTSLSELGQVKASAADQAAEIKSLAKQVGTLKDQLEEKTTEADALRHTAEASAKAAADAAETLVALRKALREAQIDPSDNALKFGSAVLFPEKRFDIDCDKKDVMAKVVAYTMYILARSPQTTITIVGHTDNRWAGVSLQEVETLNQRLSENRANSVRQYLEQAGVRSSALNAIGKGMWQPFGYDSLQSIEVVERSNRSEESRSKNRRVQFIFSRPELAEPNKDGPEPSRPQ